MRKISMNTDLQNKKKPLTETPDHEPVSREPGDRSQEIGGPSGPEPTRYGDWERRGRCIDF